MEEQSIIELKAALEYAEKVCKHIADDRFATDTDTKNWRIVIDKLQGIINKKIERIIK